jgi:6-phosphofructokinase 1
MVVEVFGRYAGHTAFRGGVAADADAVLIPEIPVNFDWLYADVKRKYMKRITDSDVHAGTYLIVVAEGLKDASGCEIFDESAGVDAFGHKRLAGAGKYVTQELTKRFKNDPAIVNFMRQEHLYVKGIYDIPEVRSVIPGHLVRCGHSSAYDVNFGKEAGAAAVVLLQNGICGVTVVDVKGSRIRYVNTQEAIKQRHVDMALVGFHEQIGMCFGRQSEGIQPKMEKVCAGIDRHL